MAHQNYLWKSWDRTYIQSNAPPRTRLYIGFGEQKVILVPSKISVINISFGEQKVTPTIRQLYEELKTREEYVLTMLKQYTKTEEVIDAIKKSGFLDLKKLASLIIWLIDVQKHKVASIDLVEDLETGQPLFISIYIEECDWDTWRILSKTVKKQLISEDFNDVAGRVALVCKQALRIRRS